MRALQPRSGWTQDELAKVEGAKPQYVARRLVFGRFLSFSPSGRNPQNLTERRFRSYWEQTEKNPNERVRAPRARVGGTLEPGQPRGGRR